jgi:tetraacyldisaccharide 4'-kinase
MRLLVLGRVRRGKAAHLLRKLLPHLRDADLFLIGAGPEAREFFGHADVHIHSAARVGDEPLLLARVAPAVGARDRMAGASLARTQGADVVIMDDGLQNPSIEKDISILVVDAVTGLGNGRLIPAGPLRERAGDALARAGAVIKVGRGHAADGLAARARNRAVPVFRAILRAAPAPELDGTPVLAFAGIGRPEKFFATLRELHADIVGTESFPDHHMFTERDARALLIRARDLNAVLVTTEKDRVRLLHAPEGSQRARLRDETKVISVRALIDEFAALEALVRDAIAAARRSLGGRAPGR